MAAIPGTVWIIASGFSRGSGLKLVDTDKPKARTWFTGAVTQISRQAERFPDCAAPPAPSEFNARGISFRPKRSGEGELLVVNHGGRESIEVFTVRWAGEIAPQLTWRGCMVMPAGYVGNAVSSYSDGTVLVTVLTRPGTTITDFVRGTKTGLVLQRAPGDTQFLPIPGTDLEGNNGLEAARDDSGFFVVAFGTRSVVRFDRGDLTGPKWSVTAPEFMPDNIHWNGDELLAAGMVRDEPACGGVRQIVNGVADTMTCHRGYIAALLNPVSRAWHAVATGEPAPSFNGVSSALLVRNKLWLGSYQADRLAVRQVPLKDNQKQNEPVR